MRVRADRSNVGLGVGPVRTARGRERTPSR